MLNPWHIFDGISGSKPRKKSPARLLLRIAISLGLLYVAYRAVNISELLSALKAFPLSTFLLIVSLYGVGQIISSLKWTVFIKNVGIERSFSQVLYAYCSAMFFNTFGLGTVGGDVARALLIKPGAGQRAGALATVVADRIHGLAVLLTIGAIAVIVVKPAILQPYGVPVALLLVLAIACGWFLGPKILVRIFPATHRFGHAARMTANAFPNKLGPFLSVTCISAIFHIFQIWMHWLIAKALGTAGALSFAYLLATVPFVNAASSLPISVQGLGVREAMYVMLFAPVGVSKELAVAIGAIWLLAVTVVSAFGGLLLAVKLPTNEEAPSESLQEQELKAPAHSQAVGE